jgi:hypothetical protein
MSDEILEINDDEMMMLGAFDVVLDCVWGSTVVSRGLDLRSGVLQSLGTAACSYEPFFLGRD